MGSPEVAADPLRHRETLQHALQQALHRVQPLSAGDPDYVAACEHLLATGSELVEWERGLPGLLDAGPHRTSRRIVLGCGALAALAGLGLLVGVAAGGTAWWWLPAVPVLLLAGWLLARTPVRAPMSGHRRQRPGAVAVAAGAVLVWSTALTDPGRAGAVWMLATAGLLLLLGLGSLRAVPVAPPVQAVRR